MTYMQYEVFLGVTFSSTNCYHYKHTKYRS